MSYYDIISLILLTIFLKSILTRFFCLKLMITDGSKKRSKKNIKNA